MSSGPSPPTSGIRWTDRVFVAGRTGSGKSVLINHLATQYRCQRFLYDTKDEFTVPGVKAVSSPAEIDWDEPVIHYVDDSGDLKDVDRVFRALWHRKVGRTGHAYGLVVVAHELGDLCADTPGGTPQWVSVYIRKGRAHGLGMVAGSQRPRNIPRVARTESEHVFSFAGGFDPEDTPVMAAMHQMSVSEFERALQQASVHGEHAYLWMDKRTRRNVIRPPLPPGKLHETLAQGIDPARYRRDEELQENEGFQESSRKAPGEFQESAWDGD